LLANAATGVRKEDIPTVSEAIMVRKHGCVILYFVRALSVATYILVCFLILDIITTSQNKAADFAKITKVKQKGARRCDYPPCQASAADLKLGSRFAKCPGCRVAIYCCKAHAVEHLSEHEDLCEELTRICDYPKCGESADIDVWCRQCKVAMYCGKRHRSKHASAHESRCEELCSYR
jgi:hypothetical protein